MAGYIGSQTPVVSNGSQRKYTFTATAAQTVFTGMDIPNPQQIQVFQNGVRLVITTDYTVSSGTTVTLVNAASAGDSLVVILFADYQLLDQDLSGDFSVDSPTFVVDSANNRVGVGTASPSATLDVNGTIKLDGNYPVGTDNVALGDTALDSLTTGTSNVAIGSGALTAGTEADRNIAIGTSALSTATTGVRNVAIGHIAGAAISSGSYNTAIGAYSLISNTTASNNTAVGYQAGYSSTTGIFNSFLGESTGRTNTTGERNTYVGHFAGYSANANRNTFIGSDAGYLITSGSKNTIIGGYSGNQGGLDIRTSSNNIVLSDGDGNPRGYYQYANGTDSLWYFQAFSSGQNCMQIKNTATSSPYGPIINFPSNAPNNTSQYLFECSDYLSPRFRVWSNGNVVNINNSYGALSDEKLKENIIDASSQWDDIKALKVRKYSMKADNLDAPNMLGVIAQEVEAVGMGGLVFESPDLDSDLNDLGTVTKQVNYSVLYMKAVKALQEAMDRIETLETENTAIKARLDALEGN